MFKLILEQLRWEFILFVYSFLLPHKHDWERDMRWEMNFTNGKTEDIIVFKKCKRCGARLASIAGFRLVQIKSYFIMLSHILAWEKGRLESDDFTKWMIDLKNEVLIEKCISNEEKVVQSMIKYMKERKYKDEK